MKNNKTRRCIALLLITVFVITALSACGAKDTTTVTTNDSQELEGAVGKKVTEYEGYLGYGYDILKNDYFNEENIDASNCVINMDDLAAAGYVREAKMNKTSLNSFSASTIMDFYAQFKGMYAGMSDYGFTGILEAYKVEAEVGAYKDQYIVMSNCGVKTQRQLIDGASAKLLSGYLTDNFKEDVENKSAKEILNDYGSYVLTDIQVGGRLSFLFYLKSVGVYAYKELAAAIAYYYEKEGIKTDDNDIDIKEYDKEKLEKAMSYINNKAIISIKAYGGDVTFNATSVSKALNKFEDWQKSVKDGASAFVDATGGIPIWELAATVNKDKGKAIKNAFYGIQDEVVEEVSGAAVK